MSKKIIILESQYKRVFLNEQVSSEEQLKKQKEELKDWFLKNGWPSNIIDMEGKSQEEALARTIVNGMDKLNRVIAEKVISEVKGNYSVCVKGFKGCRNYNDGRYYMATDFSDLVKNTSGKKIGDYRVSDVVYNSTLYFDSNEVREHILKQFKYNKNAGSSDKFPNGWWSFFKDYYGSGNYNEILNRIKSIKPYDIKSSKETLNQYKEYTGIFDGIKDCFSDYHCVLDVASIATLAIPGVGLAVSAGLDFLNAATYGVEAASAKSSEERNAAILAGGLTLFGGLLGGGVKQTKYILTKGSANPKVYNYANDVMVRFEKELPQLKNLKEGAKNAEVAKIYKETAEKYGLKEGEETLGKAILRDFSKIDPKVAKVYTDALTKIDSKVGRANLLKVGKESGFQKVLLQNNGDVVVSLSKYMKTKAGKEALIEGGLFIVLSEVMEIPEVQKWIGEKYNYLTHIRRTDIRGLVEKEGYEWKSTKELFGSTGSVEDNTLLNKAWINGWRPSEDFSKPLEWLIKKPEYQTEKFKKRVGLTKGGEPIKRMVAPENDEEREEGVKYYSDQGTLDAFEKMDDIITDEELENAYNVLEDLLK
jgi:hypothetical protein